MTSSQRTSVSLNFVKKRKTFDKWRRTKLQRFVNFWPREKKQTGILIVHPVCTFYFKHMNVTVEFVAVKKFCKM